MSGIIDTTLPQLANQVRTATVANENDRERVGSLFEGIIDYIAQNEAAWLQDTGGGSGGSLSEPGALLKKLWLKGNPEAERILKYDGSDWVPIPVPSGGGSGGGMDVAAMWTALQSTTGDYANTKIPANHLDLTSCLKTNTTFWGNTANTTSNPNTVTGSLSGGIQFVEFSNNVKIGIDPNNPDTIRIYKDNNDSAHFYATGGVSALGYSSSGGGGGGGGTPLNYILANINGSNNTVPIFDDALKYAVLRTNQGWQVLENTLGRLSNVQLNNNLDDGQALVYNSNGYWENRTVSSGGGTLSINGLDEVVNSFNSLGGGQVLTYSTSLGKWTNADLPTANGTGTNATMGIVKAGTGLSATNGVLSVNLSNSDLPSGIPVNKLAASSVTFNGASASLGNSGTITPELVIDGNTIKSKVGNQTSGGITVPFATTAGSANTANSATTAGTCTGNAGSATRLQDNTSHTIWGNTYWNNGVPNTVDSNTLTFGTDTTTVIKAESSKNIIQTTSTQSNLFEGYRNQPTQIFGKTTRFYGSSGYSGKNNALTLYNDVGHYNANDADGNNYCSAHFPLATTLPMSENTYTGAGAAAGVRIGEAILYWDAKNEALALCKYTGTANPGVANFYATGGVSALGMSSGSGSVPAMTFGNLTVTSGAAINALNTSSGSFIANSSGAKLGANKTFELNDGSVIQFNYDNSGTTLPIKLSARADGLYVSIGTNSAKKILTAS